MRFPQKLLPWCSEIIRNNSVSKFVNEERQPTENALDTWHMTKGLSKHQGQKIRNGENLASRAVWQSRVNKNSCILVYEDTTKLRKSILNLIKHYQGDHTFCFENARCRLLVNMSLPSIWLQQRKLKKFWWNFWKT